MTDRPDPALLAALILGVITLLSGCVTCSGIAVEVLR